MTTDELRAAAGELVRLHQRFAPLFGRFQRTWLWLLLAGCLFCSESCVASFAGIGKSYF